MFNVYVNGISLENKIDFEQIKNNIKAILNIEESLLESIFSFNNSDVCVRKSISENEAKSLCKLLEENGLLCFYKEDEQAVTKNSNLNKVNLSLTHRK